MATSQFKVGDRVRFRAGELPRGLIDEDANAVYTVVAVNPLDIGPVKVRREDRPNGAILGGYYDRRFERVSGVLDPKMDKNAIFTLAAAKDTRRRVIEAGIAEKLVRVRSRSWDNEGLYFAVDVATASGNRKLYRPEDVEAFLAEQKPIDLEPFMQSTRLNIIPVYQFRVNQTFVNAPDGSYWWTETDIKAKGGVVTVAGKRYRLGRQQFVPFVA